jgi:hypothetical protein
MNLRRLSDLTFMTSSNIPFDIVDEHRPPKPK